MKKYILLFVAVMGLCYSFSAGAAVNLVQNGSFERAGVDGFAYEWAPSSWGILDVSYDYPVSGRTGNAIRVSINQLDLSESEHGAMVETQYPLSVKAGDVYAYTDFLKGDGTNVSLDARFTLSDGSFSYRGFVVTKTSSVWKKTAVSIIVPSGAVVMSVYRIAESVGKFVIDDVSLTAPVLPVGKGYVTFSFDDGRNERSVIPLLKNAGIKATFFLNPTPIIENWEPGVVFTLAEVNTIVQDGHEIGNHTLTHLSLIGMAPGELVNQVVGSKELLESLTGRSVLTFSYPFGDFDAASYDLVSQYHIGARGVFGWMLNDRTSDRYNLNAFTPLQTTPVSEVLSLIDQAASSGQWLILFFHSIGPSTMGLYSFPEADLATAISYAKQKAQIITVREGLSRYIN